MTFKDALVAGLPLIAVIVGLVAWIKQLGVEGKALTISSMLVGLVLGGGYQISLGVPADFAGWFGALVFGLGCGIVASGVYKAGESLAAKATVQPPQK